MAYRVVPNRVQTSGSRMNVNALPRLEGNRVTLLPGRIDPREGPWGFKS